MSYEEAKEIFSKYLNTGTIPFVYELQEASETAIQAFNILLKEEKK